jgi:hypothetical protein
MYGCDRFGYLEFPVRAHLCVQPEASPGLAPTFFMVLVPTQLSYRLHI